MNRIDRSRPLVPSMGQHDPLGFVTGVQLAATARALDAARDGPDLSDLSAATRALEGMAASGRWATADSLGIGGLLADAARVDQLVRADASRAAGPAGAPARGGACRPAALRGGPSVARAGGGPPSVPRAGARDRTPRARPARRGGARARGLRAAGRRDRGHLVRSGPDARADVDRPTRHQHENTVMPATALAPDAYLVLSGLGPG